jgi:hypothetical protein
VIHALRRRYVDSDTVGGAEVALKGRSLLAQVVPEPSTSVLTMGGLFALMWIRKRAKDREGDRSFNRPQQSPGEA